MNVSFSVNVTLTDVMLSSTGLIRTQSGMTSCDSWSRCGVQWEVWLTPKEHMIARMSDFPVPPETAVLTANSSA